jgi:hypothetical protein
MLIMPKRCFYLQLRQVTLFPDRLKNRFDSQIEQCVKNGPTQPNNEKKYGFHLRLPALRARATGQYSSPEFIGG